MNSTDILLQSLQSYPLPSARPLITLAYAQSLDGSIATEHRQAIALSSEASFRFTHQLRAMHDAILVGIGTVLADNPRLTVRQVSGPDPQPIVLDTALRFPLTAKMLENPLRPWIVTGPDPNPTRKKKLVDMGTTIFDVDLDADGVVSLLDLTTTLYRRGIRRLMVEGGQGVLSAFLRERLVDWMVITVSPLIVAGLPALRDVQDERPFPRLRSLQHRQIGPDLLIWGQPIWGQA